MSKRKHPCKFCGHPTDHSPKCFVAKRMARNQIDPKKFLKEILDQTERNGECLELRLKIRASDRNPAPYPHIKGKRGNRVVWSLANGPIPEGLFILHRCDNTLCVNPKHLYAGTHAENTRDAVERKRHPASNRTHCPFGHPYSGKNLHMSLEGHRKCRTCKWYRNRGMLPQLELKYES